MKQEVKLNISGDRPVAFMGEELINETTKERDSTRWFRLQVYITDIIDPVSRKVKVADGLYMIGIGHITCWRGERDQYWVEEVTRGTVGAENSIKVVNALKKHEPSVPDANDPPEVAKEKWELVARYGELATWIGEQLKTDGRTENENPGNTAGGNQASVLST